LSLHFTCTKFDNNIYWLLEYDLECHKLPRTSQFLLHRVAEFYGDKPPVLTENKSV